LPLHEPITDGSREARHLAASNLGCALLAGGFVEEAIERQSEVLALANR
jgi:hypothetical protein